MTHKEKALQLFADKFHCSQAVLAAFADECGITEEQALKLGACFGSGMRKGEVCGACTGALMVLGLKFGQTDKEDLISRQRANAVNDEMMKRFAEKSGSYICNELLGCDIRTPEGVQYARDNKLFTDFCPKMVANAVDILEERGFNIMRKVFDNNLLTIFLEGRIDSNNASEIESEIFEALKANPEAMIQVDAEKLEYISSAGLRVLMKLRKQTGKEFSVINVLPEVYDIFQVTGFTDLLNVKKRLREVSIEGCEKISAGATASVYRIDKETIVKVFKSNTSMQIIQQENERSKNAFLNGIPTAISYDLVKVGDCYGTVYEMLDAQDFLKILENDKEHLEDNIKKFAHAIREMHKIEVDPAKFPPTKQASMGALPMLGSICTQEEIGKLRSLYETIPDRSTFIHGDCHTGNVMVQNGEFVFIDLMTCGSGHPVFDLGSMCSVYHMPPKFGTRKDSPLTRNFTEEESARIWDAYLRSYMDTDDSGLLKKAETQITAISAARTLFAAVFIPGLLTPDRIEYLKNVALSYVDSGLEPICF